MSSINKVILIGHIGKSPEHRKLSGDISVISFPLATTTYHKKDGNSKEDTEWHNIIMWRDMADSANKILEKGKLIYVEGKLQTRSFIKDGMTRYTTEIIVSNFTLLGRNSDFAVPESALQQL
ncbi:MAG: single-stranded DNA-binding protein [Mucilaginibacter sp.]|nr:single-stranded DNA-binding protein [Mucilaginibacter sp.]